MHTGSRMKKRRIELALSVDKLAEVLNRDRTTVYRYESGDIENMPTSVLVPLAKALKTTPAYLIGWENGNDIVDMDTPPSGPNAVRIPVYSCVHAGVALEALDTIVDYEDLSKEMTTGGKQYFGVKVSGDCMYPKYMEDDTVIILQQPTCESGQDCVVYINGNDAVLKRVIIEDGGVILQPINSKYLPKKYYYSDTNNPITIVGVAVEIRRKV